MRIRHKWHQYTSKIVILTDTNLPSASIRTADRLARLRRPEPSGIGTILSIQLPEAASHVFFP